MKLVIEISDDDYEMYRKYDHVPFSVLEAFRNAQPLPKGHRRLIDADRLKEDVHRNTVFDIYDQFVDMQPTIIEADRNEEE